MNVFLARIILYVQDVRTLAAFYRTNFGFSVVEEIENEWAVLRAGSCELALHRAGKPFRNSQASPTVTNGNAKLVLTVHDDLRSLRETLLANGVPMRGIKSYAGTGLLCDGTDPEGNVFQLAQA